MAGLGTILGGIWAKLAVAGAIVVGLLAAIGIIRKGGADAERVKRQKSDQVVRDRVDAVKPPAAGETEDRLDKGTF